MAHGSNVRDFPLGSSDVRFVTAAQSSTHGSLQKIINLSLEALFYWG
jgi:hypothetical protein